MKKLLVGLIMLSAVIASCKKDHSKPASPTLGGLQKVTFRTGFSIRTGYIQSAHGLTTNSINTNSTPDTALTNHVSELCYMVYDSIGNNLHNIYQFTPDTAFGHYVDNLAPGKYTIAIAGGTSFGVSNGPLNAAYCSGGELFFGKANITVTNTSLNQSISIDRKSSKLTITILDALPADPAAILHGTLSGVAPVFYVGSETFDASKNYQISFMYPIGSKAGTTNFQVSVIYYYNSPFNLDLSCVNNSNTIIYGEKIINGINGGVNEVTNLSGNLFGGIGTGQTGGFQTTLDTTWTTPAQVPFP